MSPPEPQDRAKQIEALCDRSIGDVYLLEPAWFQHVDDREVQLMFWRFAENHTLDKVAELYRNQSGGDYTRERVRQIINIAIRKVQRQAKLARPTLFRRSPPASLA